ncbi:MAG: galactose ABC transporter substrate-binding protein [Clostridium beijerinckii]|nr:galactose ABC transporter substrate-binding protein [Clostridium beijerinckii]MCI1585128.1 galactose ABC transporter substrate-binding protein [Clostridium beijerinckii]MCI1622469.1 galactose ABC transporter substrate-binding protein [Clostridium beijerinckii]
MSLFKKIFIFTTISFVIIIMLIGSISKSLAINLNGASIIPVKVAVFQSREDDQYNIEVRKNLEDIQKENKGKVEFTFFDGKENQVIQNESIYEAIDDHFDLFVINLVDTKVDTISDVINKIEKNNIPLILNGTPNKYILNFITPYKNIVFLGTDTEQSGALEGKIIVDSWNANKGAIDKNKDNILQYIMLQGKIDHPGTIDRTKYSISTINDAGIKTHELAIQSCNWDEECARASIDSLFLRYGNSVEAIIANNDAMAIGAVKALQKYGYNKGDKNKNVLVVGIDAIPEAMELVDKGFMTGTVIQDASAEAQAIYSVGMNLVKGKDPLEGTKYKFDDNRILRMPYREYVK